MASKAATGKSITKSEAFHQLAEATSLTRKQVTAVFDVGGVARAKPSQEFPHQLAVVVPRFLVPRDPEIERREHHQRKQDRGQGEKHPPGGAETGFGSVG